MTPGRKIRQINLSAEIFWASEVCKKVDKKQLFSLGGVQVEGFRGRLVYRGGTSPPGLSAGSGHKYSHTQERRKPWQFYSEQTVVTYLYSFNNISPPSAAGGFRKLNHRIRGEKWSAMLRQSQVAPQRWGPAWIVTCISKIISVCTQS